MSDCGVDAVTGRRAARAWVYRASIEQVAAHRFARVAEQLAATRAPAQVVALARAAAADEARHAVMCAELAVRFDPGGASRALELAAAHAADRGQASGPTATSRERLLVEVVAMSCLTETASAALLGEMVERAADDRVRAVVHEVLTDEVQHSRLGWAYLASEHAHGSVAFLGALLPELLAQTVADEIFLPIEPGSHTEDAQLAGLGALERSRRLALFSGTMREVVFPGLARYGVDPSAGAEWLAARCGSP